MRYICEREIWNPTLYLPSRDLFTNKFRNWRDMIKRRALIRFDGLYVCKFHYVRFGQSDDSEYRPCHDVFSYKYLRFFEDGTVMWVYTWVPPSKFMPKFNPYS